MEQTGHIVDDFDTFCEELQSNTGPLVLYGAGIYGQCSYTILEQADYRVAAFCDRNAAQIGPFYCGCPVISIAQLAEMRDAFILITVSPFSVQGACRGLFNAGIEKVYTVNLPDFRISDCESAETRIAGDLYASDIALKLFSLMPGETSRAVFTTWIYGLISGDHVPFEKLDGSDIRTDTTFCIAGEKLPLFRRQLASARAVQLCFSPFEEDVLKFLLELPAMGYQKIDFRKHDGKIVVEGWK